MHVVPCVAPAVEGRVTIAAVAINAATPAIAPIRRIFSPIVNLMWFEWASPPTPRPYPRQSGQSLQQRQPKRVHARRPRCTGCPLGRSYVPRTQRRPRRRLVLDGYFSEAPIGSSGVADARALATSALIPAKIWASSAGCDRAGTWSHGISILAVARCVAATVAGSQVGSNGPRCSRRRSKESSPTQRRAAQARCR